MYVVVKHSVSDPAKFWSVAQEAAASLPPGVRIHSTLPNREGSTAVCLWEADSVEAVRSLIEPTVGDVSQNEYYEVDSQKAMGLPR
jgi:hypothetical protein